MKGLVMPRHLRHNRWIFVFLALFISTSCSLLTNSGTANNTTSTDIPIESTVVAEKQTSLEDVYSSVVMIEALNKDGVGIYNGSGTIIDSKGFILTAYHLVGDNYIGELYNPDGVVKVYLTRDSSSDPEFQYYAQVVESNPVADLAVLRVILLKSGEVPVSCLNLPALTIDSSNLEPGQLVRAVGYPGIGGNSITVTSGSVSGFGEYDSSESGANDFPAVKIDAQLGPGVSGGALINDQSKLVGIPIAGREDGGTDLGLARPVSFAEQMIKDALLNPIPGCNGGRAAKLERDPSTYASYYLKGYVGFLDENNEIQTIEGATVYVFPDSVDVNNITGDEIRNPIVKATTDVDGFYYSPMQSSDYTRPVSILILKDRKSIYAQNRVMLADYYDEENDDNNFIINLE
jgi:S1-C subfamily serine protease